MLLQIVDERHLFWSLLEKMNSWAFLLGSGLKLISTELNNRFFFKYSYILYVGTAISVTAVIMAILSANDFECDVESLNKLLM